MMIVSSRTGYRGITCTKLFFRMQGEIPVASRIAFFMKRLPLTKGKFALIDEEDYERVKQWKWSLHSGGYAQRGGSVNGKKKLFYLHRFILNAAVGSEIDHINGNKLDNRKANLRLCNHSQNLWNTRKSKQNKSGYKGVSWDKRNRRFLVRIRNGKDNLYLGSFKDVIEAARTWNEAAKRYHGEFARLNALPR